MSLPLDENILPMFNQNNSIYINSKGGLGNRLLSFNGIILISIIRKKNPISILVNFSVELE